MRYYCNAMNNERRLGCMRVHVRVRVRVCVPTDASLSQLYMLIMYNGVSCKFRSTPTHRRLINMFRSRNKRNVEIVGRRFDMVRYGTENCCAGGALSSRTLHAICVLHISGQAISLLVRHSVSVNHHPQKLFPSIACSHARSHCNSKS